MWHWQWAIYCQGKGHWSPLPSGIGKTRFSNRLGAFRVHSRLVNGVLRLVARYVTQPKGFLLPKALRLPPEKRKKPRRKVKRP